MRYITEFLGIYPYFCTCSEVLKSLRDVYFCPKLPPGFLKASAPAYTQKIQRRVLFVLTRWLQNYPRQFYEASAIGQLREFLEELENTPEKTILGELFQSVCKHSGYYIMLIFLKK